MSKLSNKPKSPRDPNAIAFNIVAQATGDAHKDEPVVPPGKNPAAVALGKLGGLKGGIARSNALSKERRIEISKKAAAKRWGHRDR